MTEHTFATVAKFMKDELDRKKWLYQEDIAAHIQHDFGEPFVYFNANGNLGINKTVLKEFKKISPDCVWERGDKCWRKREKWDTDSKRGQD